MRAKAVAAAALAALVLGWGAARAQEDELPRIFLEKKIFAETKSGKKSFYEVHAVEEGESLWKILHRRGPLPSEDYAALLKEFRRVNPQVADPDRIKPGEQIFVPSAPPRLADRRIAEGTAVAYRVGAGDTLTEILASRGVERAEMAEYLAAVKELNESVRDVNLIYAGKTLLLPTERHFAAAPAPEPGTIAAATPLTKDAPSPAAGELPPAKPEAQLVPPSGPEAQLAGGVVVPGRAGDNAAQGEGLSARPAEGALPQPKPPYRGLLSDLLRGIGEKWMDRGMLYLPVPSGGEVVLPLEDYPVARFSTGVDALIDFRSALPGDVRAVVERTWKSYTVVGMGDAQGPTEMINRLLRSSGYHSVKDGLARPLVIGEAVAVSIPARWVVLRTEKSLLSGEVILVKEVPEKPGYSLSAALRYAERVGIRVLPYAIDPAAREGFMVAVEEGSGDGEEEAPSPTLSRGGLAAVDSALAFLGIPPIEEERLTIGGKGGAFRLTIEPERMFAAGGKRFVVDTGKMSPAVRAIVRDSGYAVFPVGKDETGSSIVRRLLAAAGLASEERRDFLLAGGDTEGFEVRATGLFITSAEWLGSRNLRAAIVVRGRVHPATRALLRDFGVEIAGWSS